MECGLSPIIGFGFSLYPMTDSFVVVIKGALEESEKELILIALREVHGNKAKASRTIGISRTGLYAKMKKYQLT